MYKSCHFSNGKMWGLNRLDKFKNFLKIIYLTNIFLFITFIIRKYKFLFF